MSELLIALAILGVIATFTLPKVLEAQQETKMMALTREAAATLAESLVVHRSVNGITGTDGIDSLTPYMNYVRVATNLTVQYPNGNPRTCAAPYVCVVLHNGGVFVHHPARSFAGTGATNADYIYFDPDGTGATPSVQFYLYVTGRVTTGQSILPGTCIGDPGLDCTPTVYNDPSWLSWN